MAINIASFSHLLKRVDFGAIIDHLALTHIIKSKMGLATTRIKKLLELISSYSFNLYYMKGKDMVLSDFLLQQSNDDSNPNKIIPISYNTYKILEDNMGNFGKYNNDFSSEKIPNSDTFSSQNEWYKAPGSSWSTKRIRSKFKTRKATCHFQTGQITEAMDGSRKSGIKEKKT